MAQNTAAFKRPPVKELPSKPAGEFVDDATGLLGVAVDYERRHGRGAHSNATGRYEPLARIAFDDGWRTLDDLPVFKTTVQTDATRKIITRNESPDIGFDRSINPYRGCEHGCVYCFARPTHAYLGLSPGLDFESKLFVKPEAAELLEKELAKFTDLTVFTFLYPILGSDSVEKARSVWCSADRARVWEDWMIRNLVPQVAPADCKAKFIDPTLAFGRKLEITAVPTMFFSDGDRIDGSRSANEMNAKFKSYSLGVDDAIVTVNRLMRDSQLATDRTTIMRSQTTPPSNAAPADARGEQAKPTTRPARVPADLCDPCAMAAARMQMPGGCPYRENPCAAPPTDGNGRTSR